MSHSQITHQQLIAYAAGEIRGADAERVRAHLERDADAARTVHRYRPARQTVRGDNGADPPTVVMERAGSIGAPTLHRARLTTLAGWRGGPDSGPAGPGRSLNYCKSP